VLPEGWVWVKLKDAFEFNPKNDINDEIPVSFIPMNLISDSFTNKHISEIRKWKEIKKGFTHFREGDVGIAKITPCFENRKSVVFKNLESGYGAGTTELHILRPIFDPFLSNYLIWFVKTENFITNGVNCFTGAVGQQRIGRNVIGDTLFPLPPLAEQKRIVQKIDSIFETLNLIQNNL
jgi:type I restriction enzyme S subunit